MHLNTTGIILVWLGCAIAAAIIGHLKGDGITLSFLIGAILGPLGLAFVALWPSRTYPEPAHRRQ